MDGFSQKEFMTNESDMPDVLGLSLNELRTLREGLSEGTDWIRKGRAVFYTEAGSARLLEILNISKIAEKKEGARERRELWVKLLVRNPRMLMAVATFEEVRGADAGRFRVQVRDASKFVPGMRLDACRHLQADLYVFEGQAPRNRKLAFLKKTGGAQ